jgi:hypothetical protein
VGGDQGLSRWCEGRQHRDDGERGAADEEQPPPADPVPERTHGDEEARDE